MKIWAVARQMIAEGIRMKIAVVFLVILLMVLLGLPFSITGDNSVTGAVQSFLTYSLSVTGLLLGLLTIFLSRSLSDELSNRQILLVMTKPIPRWQFILGKWLGITLLNGLFLAFAGLSAFGMVHYIQRNPPNQRQSEPERRVDEAELRNEVLVARHAAQVVPPDFSRPAQAEFERNMEEGKYVDVPGFDPAVEKQRLLKKYEARWRVIGPQDNRVFEFRNILCDRDPANTIHLRYKTEVSQYPPDEIYRALWRFGDPTRGSRSYIVPVRHVVGRFHTIAVPADSVAPDGTLSVMLSNYNPFEGEVQWRNVLEIRASDGVEVLFVVGGFGWNLVRLLVLMMCKLMFLAGVAVLMTTMFSFPVACLASFTVYALAGSRSFLSEAFDYVSEDTASMFASFKEFLVQLIALVYNGIGWILPDFGRYNAIETFVNGRNVSLVWVLQGIGELVIVKLAVVLGLAMLLFYRREVAEVSF